MCIGSGKPGKRPMVPGSRPPPPLAERAVSLCLLASYLRGRSGSVYVHAEEDHSSYPPSGGVTRTEAMRREITTPSSSSES